MAETATTYDYEINQVRIYTDLALVDFHQFRYGNSHNGFKFGEDCKGAIAVNLQRRSKLRAFPRFPVSAQ